MIWCLVSSASLCVPTSISINVSSYSLSQHLHVSNMVLVSRVSLKVIFGILNTKQSRIHGNILHPPTSSCLRIQEQSEQQNLKGSPGNYKWLLVANTSAGDNSLSSRMTCLGLSYDMSCLPTTSQACQHLILSITQLLKSLKSHSHSWTHDDVP